ncbi:MAG: dienelactone hydrolase family protein, partial [Gemmatimonadaceae bacterium]
MYRLTARVATALSFAGIAACTAARSSAPATTPPAAVTESRARLAASPRHGEWVMVSAGADSVRAWIVYPERTTKAPVVVVVHEIYGLTPWIRGVADQLAADGFVAIAPDLLTTKNLPNPTDSVPGNLATAAIRTLDPADVHRQISAVASYAMSQPAALPRYGIVGFCWGGSVSFEHAIRSPGLGASVVYYGSSPPSESLGPINAPV